MAKLGKGKKIASYMKLYPILPNKPKAKAKKKITVLKKEK